MNHVRRRTAWRLTHSRRRLSVVRAEGDPVLEEVLTMHLSYKNGRAESPTLVDGIWFYSVGRNATHRFLAGTKDGRRYVVASDQSLEEEPESMTAMKVEQWGYLGHH